MKGKVSKKYCILTLYKSNRVIQTKEKD